MSKLDIPESWAEASLADCSSELGRGKSPKYSEKETGYFVVNQRCIYWDSFRPENRKYGTKDWFNGVAERLRLRTGDILLNSTGTGTLGRAVCLESPFLDSIPDSHVTVIRTKEQLNPKFLTALLKSAIGQEAIGHATTGSTNQIELNKSKLAEASIPIPPLGEQKRIVAKIESTQEKIKTIEQSVTKAEELIGKYREALLQKAFRGELVPQDPNDEPASKLLERIRDDRAKQTDSKKKKKDDLPPIKPEEIPFEIPKSWEWVRLGDVIDLKHGHAFKSEKFGKSGQYVLTTPGHFFENGGFRDQGAKTKYYIAQPDKGFILQSGDMIIAMTEQAPGLLGSAALIPSDGKVYLHNQRLGKITASTSGTVTKEYLYSYFNHSYLRNKLAGSCSGSTVRHTSPDRIFSVLIPLPPFEEQKRIANRLVQISTTLQTLKSELIPLGDVVQSLGRALLANAFSGRLVAQDAVEGTGHDLLDKIQYQTIAAYADKVVDSKSKQKRRVKK